MIVGYVAAAGIVVIILVGFYLLAFDPAVDCFHENRDSQGQAVLSNFRPNRLDEALLQRLRRFGKACNAFVTGGELPASSGPETAVAQPADPPDDSSYRSRVRKGLSKVRQ